MMAMKQMQFLSLIADLDPTNSATVSVVYSSTSEDGEPLLSRPIGILYVEGGAFAGWEIAQEEVERTYEEQPNKSASGWDVTTGIMMGLAFLSISVAAYLFVWGQINVASLAAFQTMRSLALGLFIFLFDQPTILG